MQTIKKIRAIINKAIKAKKTIVFNYTDAKNHTTEREVKPENLFEDAKNGFGFTGFCLLRDDLRTFYLSRMTAVSVVLTVVKLDNKTRFDYLIEKLNSDLRA